MSLMQRVRKALGTMAVFAAIAPAAHSQPSYVTQGGEYAPAGLLPGDQANPALSLATSGGFLVWQDNITDGDGLGISAVRLDSSFSPQFGNFRVNQQGTDDQENPKVSLLKNGGAAFVWQGGKQGFQHVYARFLDTNYLWITGDVQVNTATNYQDLPVMATLNNGNVVVAWSSYGQDNADGFQGVYAQLLSPTGTKVGSEIQVNQFTPFNQRTPSVANLPSGGFVMVWVSEQQRSSQSVSSGGNVSQASANSVDIYGRLFDATGSPTSSEFLINTSTNVCADPGVAVASDGSYFVVWCEKNEIVRNNSWDIWGRRFSSGTIGGTVQRINTQLYGDQYGPKISSLGTDYLVVWTSLGQDGSREGVIGQFLHGDGSASGNEFIVNTTVLNQQIEPALASDGASRFLGVWASYNGLDTRLDLEAQRFATYQLPLSPPSTPWVTPVDSYDLSVAWPSIAGFSVSYYQLYIDGAAYPLLVTNTFWQSPPPPPNPYFFPSTTHTFQLAYVLTDGRVSPLSGTATNRTWGFDFNSDGLPDDWETSVWGSNMANWHGANYQLSPGGPTVLQVFKWGANPNDAGTWLKANISHDYQGWYLAWNTRPGSVYQVQTSTDLLNWTNRGAPRFSAGTSDSIYLGISNNGYYRITRVAYFPY